MLPIYMIPRQEFGLRKKHLRPIHLFSGFVLMPDTAKPLSRMFPVNWGLASIFRRVSSLYGRSCPSGGSESVLWRGSTTPAGGFHPAAGGSLRPLYLIQLLDGEAQLCHHILLGRIAVKAVVVGGNIHAVVRTDVAIVIFDM